MKYTTFDTQSEAEAEISRIEVILGIPVGRIKKYTDVEEINGKYAVRVKESGSWKCDHLVNGTIIDYTPPTPDDD
jgi:hypothetical protein